jgi:hypothetical protein
MAEQLNQQETNDIADALASGRKIEAIKIYRQATGKGLKKAKEFIEALIPELVAQDPEKYNRLTAPQGAGCASVILVCMGLGLAGVLIISLIS